MKKIHPWKKNCYDNFMFLLYFSTIAAASNLVKSGWKIILVGVIKVNSYETELMLSQQVKNWNYHLVGSFVEMNTLAFKEQLIKSVCSGVDGKFKICQVRNSTLIQKKGSNYWKM